MLFRSTVLLGMQTETYWNFLLTSRVVLIDVAQASPVSLISCSGSLSAYSLPCQTGAVRTTSAVEWLYLVSMLKGTHRCWRTCSLVWWWVVPWYRHKCCNDMQYQHQLRKQQTSTQNCVLWLSASVTPQYTQTFHDHFHMYLQCVT